MSLVEVQLFMALSVKRVWLCLNLSDTGLYNAGVIAIKSASIHQLKTRAKPEVLKSKLFKMILTR